MHKSKKLTRRQLAEITSLQKDSQHGFRSVPGSGMKIEYLGKEFVVYKNVFWPFEDSKPLVENYIVKPGEYVLDVGTGSGLIAVFSAYKGARGVVAVDINPEAVKNAKANAELHGFSNVIDVRLSDMFEALKEGELFDVITANLPIRNKRASDMVELSQWDSGGRTRKKFFAGVGKYLKEGGRIYITQANFGAVGDMKRLAKSAGFDVKLIGKNAMPDDPRIFYAFELLRKGK